MNYTATKDLSLEVYAEPFVTTGHYAEPRDLASPRAERFGDRYRAYATGALEDFNCKSLRSNTVLRWEYRAGSALFLVWTQGREQDERNPGVFRARRDYRDLFGAHPDHTFLVKASYWLGR